MINSKYSIRKQEGVSSEYKLVHSFHTNYEDDFYDGVARHIEETQFIGTLSECNAFLELKGKRVDLSDIKL